MISSLLRNGSQVSLEFMKKTVNCLSDGTNLDHSYSIITERRHSQVVSSCHHCEALPRNDRFVVPTSTQNTQLKPFVNLDRNF